MPQRIFCDKCNTTLHYGDLEYPGEIIARYNGRCPNPECREKIEYDPADVKFKEYK